MKITLKKLRHHKSLSQDSNAFSADVYVDDKKVAAATDDGWGGNIQFEPYDPELLNKVIEWTKTLPDVEFEIDGEKHLLNQSLDLIVGNMVQEDLFNKELKRIANREYKKLQFIFGGELYSFPTKHKNTTDKAVLQYYSKAAEKDGYTDVIFTGQLEKEVAIEVLMAFNNGEISTEDRLDTIASILIDKGHLDRELVQSTLSIDLADDVSPR
jgi:hypothetical protein